MKEELQSLIQQHLPALAAGEMKAYIEQAEKDKKELETVKLSLKASREAVDAQSKELSEFKREAQFVINKTSELVEKEKALNQKEFNLKLEELKYQLQAEKESKQSIFALVSTFVANPRAIEVTTRNRTYNHQTDYSPTGGTTHYPTTSFESETKEHREEK